MGKTPTINYKWLVAATGVLVAGFLMWYFQTIVFYVLGAAAVSLIGGPIVKLIEKIKIHGWSTPRWMSAMIALVLLLGLFFVLCWALVPMIADKITALSKINPEHVELMLRSVVGNIEDWLHESLPGVDISLRETLKSHLDPFLNSGIIKDFFSGITTFVVEVCVAVFSISFISFFFLKDEKLFNSGVVMFFPKKYEQSIVRAINSSINLLGRYFIGICLESLIKFIVVAFSLYFMGMEFTTAAMIGVVTAVLNVIPYIGPLIGALLAFAIAAFSATPMIVPIWEQFFHITVVLMVFQLIDNVVLQPYIYSSSVKAHPLEIFLVILMAGYVGGVLGMLLAIPTYTVLRVFAKEFFAGMRVVKKLTENL